MQASLKDCQLIAQELLVMRKKVFFGYLWWGDRGDWWLVLWDCDSPVLHPGVVAITTRGAQEDATCLLWAQSYLAKHCEDFILIR